MRTSLCVIAALGAVGAATLAAGAGCGSLPNDCLLTLTCPTSGGGAGGDLQPTPDECIPNKDTSKPVDNACGIFVTSGAKGMDSAEGSKERPLKTLAAAVAKAKSAGLRPIYACAEIFTEAISLDAPLELYGGLDCGANWTYIGGVRKTTLTADADQIPLTLTKESSDAKVADFAIAAKDGMSAGQSSIAVVADQAKASFERCEITTGNGVAGLLGATPDAPVGPLKQTDPEIVGYDGQNASCAATNQTPGGMQKQSMYCMGRTIGGNGGGGDRTQGYAGAASSSGDPYTALGGAGQAAADTTLDCSIDATSNPKGGRGSNGSNGVAGTDGDGARDNSPGSIDASGYKGAAGKDGGDGQSGKGGGGGGGAKGKVLSNCVGASGGGGGVGGCGGVGGKGGGGGGSSIGIISLTAQLTFDAVIIKVGGGGSGGDGGDGQPGGLGGRGGSGGVAGTAGSANACTGGDGGTGGNGGKGGGGRGGHSIGIAYASATDQEMPGVQIMTSMPGAGGKGADTSKDGVAGLQAERHRFQ